MTTKTITLNNFNIAEAVIGDVDARPVLMLHGWGANISLMWQVAQSLAPRGYRVYVPDMPGFGDSDEPPKAWSVFDYANWVLCYMAHHNLEEVFLFGHSFGGRLGLILGADHPNRITSMVLADSAGIRPKLPFATQVRTQVYKSVRDGLKSLGMSGLSDNLRQRYNARYGSSDFQNVSGIMRETFVKVINQDLLGHAARVAIPTLLIWGENDDETPLWMGQKLEQTIPDAALVIFPSAGHYSYLEDVTRTVSIMDALYKS